MIPIGKAVELRKALAKKHGDDEPDDPPEKTDPETIVNPALCSDF